jgi:hypothetical protein
LRVHASRPVIERSTMAGWFMAIIMGQMRRPCHGAEGLS